MLNIIIENGPTSEGIPEKLSKILETRFLDNRIVHFSIMDTMHNDSVRFIDSIKTGDSIISHTNFHESHIENTIHIMEHLMKNGQKITFYIVFEEEVYETIEEAFTKYYLRDQAFITPPQYVGKEKYYKYIMMNNLMSDVLRWHKLYRIFSDNPAEDKLLTMHSILERALKASRYLQP